MEKQLKKIDLKMRNSLRAGFPDKAYSNHPTKTFLTTLKAMYVTERLNDVFGIGRWSVKHEIVERTNDYILISGEFVSLDYDVIVPVQYGGHKTTGKNTEIADGFKSAVTDCISKIASILEIGIDMFKGEIKPKNKDLAKDNNKPWLNIYKDKTKKEYTKQATELGAKIKNKEITTLDQVRELYKVSKEVAPVVESWIKLIK